MTIINTALIESITNKTSSATGVDFDIERQFISIMRTLADRNIVAANCVLQLIKRRVCIAKNEHVPPLGKQLLDVLMTIIAHDDSTDIPSMLAERLQFDVPEWTDAQIKLLHKHNYADIARAIYLNHITHKLIAFKPFKDHAPLFTRIAQYEKRLMDITNAKTEAINIASGSRYDTRVIKTHNYVNSYKQEFNTLLSDFNNYDRKREINKPVLNSCKIQSEHVLLVTGSSAVLYSNDNNVCELFEFKMHLPELVQVIILADAFPKFIDTMLAQLVYNLYNTGHAFVDVIFSQKGLEEYLMVIFSNNKRKLLSSLPSSTFIRDATYYNMHKSLQESTQFSHRDILIFMFFNHKLNLIKE